MNLHVNVIGDIARMQLNPGDAIVLTVDAVLSSEIADRLRAALSERFPSNRCIVLERGMDLRVVAASEVDSLCG